MGTLPLKRQAEDAGGEKEPVKEQCEEKASRVKKIITPPKVSAEW